MALIKYKPRTPGTRAVVKIDRSHLHKGGPHLPLTAAQSKTGARNHFGRITTRHHGGITPEEYPLIDVKRDNGRSSPEAEPVEDHPDHARHIRLNRHTDSIMGHSLATQGR